MVANEQFEAGAMYKAIRYQSVPGSAVRMPNHSYRQGPAHRYRIQATHQVPVTFHIRQAQIPPYAQRDSPLK